MTSPSPRDEALEEAALECDKLARENKWGSKYLGAIWCAHLIRSLKSKPELTIDLVEHRQRIERNARISARWDSLRSAGRHGIYETIYKIVDEEIQRALPKKEDDNG